MSAPHPQRALIVLPSTGEFDSRTYRIGRSLTERGHSVTILARWRPGLAREETTEEGVRIVRVEASAIDGLPLAGLVKWLRQLVRRFDARRARRAPGGTSAREPATPADGQRSDSAPRAFPRRLGAWLVANLAIPLTIRSHRQRARELAPPADLVHGMAYMGVPVALDLARRSGASVVYDARDIYLDAGNLARLPGPIRWFVGRQERRWARAVDRVVTVNDGYANVMASRWGVEAPIVVLNCSFRFQPPAPRERLFHQALGLPEASRVVLYQGGFSRDRGIEELIAAVGSVPDATLVLMGYGKLAAELRRTEADPLTAGRVRLLPAVPPVDLLRWVASADVVAIPIQPTTLNHRLTTPNKLFEALAAGVPVVASDLPGMATIVHETGCGRLVDPTDPDAIAGALNQLLALPDDEMTVLRRRCLAAAHQRYSWEEQAGVLLAEYSRLTGRAW